MRKAGWIIALLLVLAVIGCVFVFGRPQQPVSNQLEHMTLNVDDKGVNDGAS